MNDVLNTLEQSPTVALADKVRLLESNGRKIIPLHTGDPDFSTHEIIIEAANKAIRDGYTHYSNSRGLPDLREEICNYSNKKYNANLSPNEEILITHGGIHSFYIAVKCIINNGDEILLPDPTWVSHINVVKSCGGEPVSYILKEESNFLPDISELNNLVTPKTKAIVINFPSNPLGTIADKKLLGQLLEFAEKNNLFIISDEVYDHIIFNNLTYNSSLSFASYKERVIICQSFSKTFAMTGWRIGYLIASKNIINQALKISQCTITNVVPFIQKAALAALQSKEVWSYVDQMNCEYEKRADAVMDLFKKYPNRKITTRKPDGAFYFFVNIKGLGWGNSLETSMKILEDLSIAVVPGSAFGKNGEGYIRTTFATSMANVLEGFKKLLSI